ncbi:MAG TPA: FtsX-like permease family protein [Lachnospiraceae bacterium]|nr:FtsX-like permease family protein [Lachnospiraceae bacterium]
MKISDLIKMGLRNLLRRKARTALTVVGVVIGTISILVMFSISIGMNTSFTKQMNDMGSLTSITISKFAPIKDDSGNYIDSKEQVIDDNLLKLINEIEHVKTATPIISADMSVRIGSKIMGYAPVQALDYEALMNLDLPKTTFGELPIDENSEVIIMGSGIPKNYFYNMRNGATYEYNPQKDKLVGTINLYQYQLKDDSKSAEFFIKDKVAILEQNSQFDYQCYMSIKAYKKWYEKAVQYLKTSDKKKAMKDLNEYQQIQVVVDTVDNVDKVESTINDMGYKTESLNQTRKPLQKTSKMLQTVLGGVGIVAMVVSAVSIANTMVMSIYERTKEIGVMKVLGCCISDIKKLFLFEAGMIGFIGSIIGLIFGFIASYCINKFGKPLFEALMKSTTVSYEPTTVTTQFSIIPFWLPFLAIGIGIFVGVLSGYFPARRATKISAIEAMKTEG